MKQWPPRKGQLLDVAATLRDAGLRDGDDVDAVVQPVQLATTGKAFAYTSQRVRL